MMLCLAVACQAAPASPQAFANRIVHGIKHSSADLLLFLPSPQLIRSLMVCTEKGDQNIAVALEKSQSEVLQTQRQFRDVFSELQLHSFTITKTTPVQRGEAQGSCITSRDFEIMHMNLNIRTSKDQELIPVRLEVLYVDRRYYLLGM